MWISGSVSLVHFMNIELKYSEQAGKKENSQKEGILFKSPVILARSCWAKTEPVSFSPDPMWPFQTGRAESTAGVNQCIIIDFNRPIFFYTSGGAGPRSFRGPNWGHIPVPDPTEICLVTLPIPPYSTISCVHFLSIFHLPVLNLPLLPVACTDLVRPVCSLVLSSWVVFGFWPVLMSLQLWSRSVYNNSPDKERCFLGWRGAFWA